MRATHPECGAELCDLIEAVTSLTINTPHQGDEVIIIFTFSRFCPSQDFFAILPTLAIQLTKKPSLPRDWGRDGVNYALKSLLLAGKFLLERSESLEVAQSSLLERSVECGSLLGSSATTLATATLAALLAGLLSTLALLLILKDA